VGFAVFFRRPGIKASDCVEVEVRKSEKSSAAEGSWMAPGRGQIVLVYDNPSSWSSAKEVQYTITTIPSSEEEGQHSIPLDAGSRLCPAASPSISTPATVAAGIPATGQLAQAKSAVQPTPAAQVGGGSEGATKQASSGSDGALMAEFIAAARRAKAAPSATEPERNRLHALYRQGHAGKCNVDRPSGFNFTGKAKWDAWNALGDLDQDDAKRQFIALVGSLVPTTEASS